MFYVGILIYGVMNNGIDVFGVCLVGVCMFVGLMIGCDDSGVVCSIYLFLLFWILCCVLSISGLDDVVVLVVRLWMSIVVFIMRCVWVL